MGVRNRTPYPSPTDCLVLVDWAVIPSHSADLINMYWKIQYSSINLQQRNKNRHVRLKCLSVKKMKNKIPVQHVTQPNPITPYCPGYGCSATTNCCNDIGLTNNKTYGVSAIVHQRRNIHTLKKKSHMPTRIITCIVSSAFILF